ncbi:hypothetical protein YC2023_016449 [Brassica napus]
MSPSPPLAPPRDLSSKSAQIPVVLCSGDARRRFAVVGVVLQIPRREGSYSTMVHFLLFVYLVLRLSEILKLTQKLSYFHKGPLEFALNLSIIQITQANIQNLQPWSLVS